MELIDTHCHLDVEEFDVDREEVVSRCRASHIEHIVVPGIAADGWDNLLSICQRHAGLHPALGMHPLYIEQHDDQHLRQLERRIDQVQPVAVGEIGLDYYVRELDRDRQQQLFEAQLAIAANAGLPVLLHVRKAHDSVLAALRRTKIGGGIAHAFNGSLQQAHQYLDLGFKLGFGGMLTFERSNKLRRLARELPADAFVLETDAPDMTVASHRGQRNSPEYLTECLAALAQVRDTPPETVAWQTTANALQVLGLGNLCTGR